MLRSSVSCSRSSKVRIPFLSVSTSAESNPRNASSGKYSSDKGISPSAGRGGVGVAVGVGVGVEIGGCAIAGVGFGVTVGACVTVGVGFGETVGGCVIVGASATVEDSVIVGITVEGNSDTADEGGVTVGVSVIVVAPTVESSDMAGVGIVSVGTAFCVGLGVIMDGGAVAGETGGDISKSVGVAKVGVVLEKSPESILVSLEQLDKNKMITKRPKKYFFIP